MVIYICRRYITHLQIVVESSSTCWENGCPFGSSTENMTLWTEVCLTQSPLVYSVPNNTMGLNLENVKLAFEKLQTDGNKTQHVAPWSIKIF